MLKIEARDRAKRARATLGDQERKALSSLICDCFFKEISLQGVLHMNCFLPIERQYEPDTRPILRTLEEKHQHISVSVPYMLPTDRDFRAAEWAHSRPTVAGPFGMPLPQNLVEVNPALIDIVLVPLMAVNRQGHRIGYGGGFYDRFLARCRPGVRKLGLSFFPPIDEPIEDLHEHDIRLNAVVTPRGVIEFPR